MVKALLNSALLFSLLALTQNGTSFVVPACQAAGLRPSVVTDGIGTDPLTATEENRALTISQSSSRLVAAKTVAAQRKAPLFGLSPVQYLYTSLHVPSASDQVTGRLAAVFYYNYATDEIFRQIVDLKKNIIKEESLTSGLENQPSVTQAETEAAFQMLLSHPKYGPTLRSIYSKISPQPLTSSDQMGAQAGLLFPSSKIGTPLEDITRVCQTHRCVQIFLHGAGDTLIDLNNVILDLSAGEVLWR